MRQETQDRNPDYPSGDRSIHAVRLLDFKKRSFLKSPAATAKTFENRYKMQYHACT